MRRRGEEEPATASARVWLFDVCEHVHRYHRPSVRLLLQSNRSAAVEAMLAQIAADAQQAPCVCRN